MGYGHEKGNSVQGSIKGFFFDLDGTLIDTAEANYIAYSEAINNVCGVQVSRQEFRKTNGMVYKDFLALLVPNITDAKIEQISVYKKDAYVKQLDKTTPNTFLLNFLKNMAENYVTVLVTTAKKDNAAAVLARYGLNGMFNYTIFGDDVKNMKPNPEAYMKALELSNLNPKEVIAFEDSNAGIMAAQKAGIPTIHIRSFNEN